MTSYHLQIYYFPYVIKLLIVTNMTHKYDIREIINLSIPVCCV